MSQRNVEIVRLAFEAFNEGDWDRALVYGREDIVWVNLVGQNFDQPESVRGRDQVRRFWESFFDVWDSSAMELVETVPGRDGRVLAEVRFEAHGEGSGVPVVLDFCQVYVINDGFIARIENYATRKEAVEAAGLDQPGSSSQE
jgi:ketosteroid isomerase-like protein